MKQTIKGMALAMMAMPLLATSSEVIIPNTFVGGTKAVAEEVNANFDAAAAAINDNDSRISVLEAGMPTDLTTIQNISWQHNQAITVTDFINNGLFVWFSNPVLSSSLLVPNYNYHVQLFKLGADWELQFDIDINEISDVSVDAEGMIESAVIETDPVSEIVQGFQLIRTNAVNSDGTYKLVIRGDFVSDINGRAVDGNFLVGETPTGDSVAGGTFESIFRVIP